MCFPFKVWSWSFDRYTFKQCWASRTMIFEEKESHLRKSCEYDGCGQRVSKANPWSGVLVSYLGEPCSAQQVLWPWQVMPGSALLSGLLGDINEKILSARRRDWHRANAQNVTMTIITTSSNPLGLGLTSIFDTKKERKLSQFRGLLISYTFSCLSPYV